MKRRFLILIAIAALGTALTTNAFGQTGKTVRANVKFDFQIGERVYPAGEYWIESVSRLSDNVLQIRSAGDANTNKFIFARSCLRGQKAKPKLVFQRYGENYFLIQIFLDTELSGYSIGPSRQQREREKNLALASLETITRLGKVKKEMKK